MNFFAGTFTGATLDCDGFTYELTDRMESNVDEDDQFTLGIRPEDIELHDEPSDTNSFEVVIDVVEPMGSLSYVYPKVVGQDREESFIVEVDGQLPISEGDRLYAQIPSEDVHLFDGASGETVHQRQLTADADASLSQRFQRGSATSD
jgi:multiple sugar transport system ATP-binding protein